MLNTRFLHFFFLSLDVLLALNFALLETRSMLWTSLVKQLRLADEKNRKMGKIGPSII